MPNTSMTKNTAANIDTPIFTMVMGTLSFLRLCWPFLFCSERIAGSRNSPQCLHFLASDFITSEQYGQYAFCSTGSSPASATGSHASAFDGAGNWSSALSSDLLAGIWILDSHFGQRRFLPASFSSACIRALHDGQITAIGITQAPRSYPYTITPHTFNAARVRFAKFSRLQDSVSLLQMGAHDRNQFRVFGIVNRFRSRSTGCAGKPAQYLPEADFRIRVAEFDKQFQHFTAFSGHGSRSHRIRQSHLQCRARAFHQIVVLCAAALEPVGVGGEVAVAILRRHVVVILQHGRAEFVVVRIDAFEEDQHASGVDEALGIAAVGKVAERVRRSRGAVLAYFGEDLGWRERLALGDARLQLVDA